MVLITILLFIELSHLFYYTINKNYSLYEKNIVQLRNNLKYLNKTTNEIKKFIEKLT